MKSTVYPAYSFKLVCNKLVFLSYDFNDKVPQPMGYNFLLLVKHEKKLIWVRLNCLWFIEDAKALGRSFIENHAVFNCDLLHEVLKNRYDFKGLAEFVKANAATLFYYPDFENLNKFKKKELDNGVSVDGKADRLEDLNEADDDKYGLVESRNFPGVWDVQKKIAELDNAADLLADKLKVGLN